LDLVSGQEIRKLSIGRPLWSVKYDPQGRRLAVGSGHVDVRDAETGEVVFKGAPLDGLGVLAWRPDGKWLAVGTTPDVHLFEVAPAEGRHLVLHGHRSAIIGLQFHPQGQLLASTSWDGTTRLWDSASGQQLLCVEGHLIGVSEDGQLLACRQGLDVVLFSVVTPCAHRWLPRGMTYAVAVAPGDRLMAACHDDGVRLWDLDQLEQVAYLPIGVTRGVAFPAPTGQLVTSGRAGLYQWPIRTESQGGVERVRLGPPEAINPDLKNMHSVHFSRDGSTLLSEAFFRDEAFLLHAADPGLPPIRLTRPGLSLSALSPDTKWAAASSSIAPDVRIWNAGTSGHVCDLPTPGGAQICFSPDGRSVITNAGPEMRIWDVGTWKPRHETSFKSDSASAIAFTSDSRIAAIGAWGVGVMLIEVETGRRVAMLDLPEKPPVYVGLEFTSDGSRLIAAVDHAGCCVWDIRALREQLATLGLDWNQPPLPKPDAATARPPIQVDIDLGDLAAKKPP
jgi:WD40 repeat protein